MPRRGGRRPDADEEEDGTLDGADEAEDEEPSGPPKRRSKAPRFPKGVQAWKDKPEGEDEVGEEEEFEGPLARWHHRSVVPVFFRARDAWWFEPIIALAIVVLLLVSLYAYTGNWPPVYVVESESMQHGTTDQVGLINTGDLVLAQRTSPSQVITYEQGASTGYQTYGEYGDVLLFYPNGEGGVTPVIHRAIVYLEYNLNGSYSAPALEGKPCGGQQGAIYSNSGSLDHCGAESLRGTLTLFGIGWQNVTVQVALAPAALGTSDGFLTMGDNNYRPGAPAMGEPDEPTLTRLVQAGWIIGAARGMIPWFGAVKLLLSGQASEVPAQSWEFLAITLILVILGGIGLHYALRSEGVEDERRKEQEEEEEREEDDAPPRRKFHWPLIGRGTHDDEDGEENDSDGVSAHTRRERKDAPRGLGGRPRPRVRTRNGHSARPRKGSGKRDRDDDL